MRRVLLVVVGVCFLCAGVASVGTTVDVADPTYTAESVPADQVDEDDDVTSVEELPSQTRRVAKGLLEGETYEPKRYQVSIAAVHFVTISTDDGGVYLGLSPHAERLRSVRYLEQDGTHYRVTDQGGAVPADLLPKHVLSAVLLVVGSLSVARGAGLLDTSEIVIDE
ncbi:hypothetical protein [Halorussus ruber]|uniref:hypothetical protein n=1 Tax=Halorussus ruber TaxID=1126238 RepID=UPI001092FDC9|nr:hypothetical protein [Halorussus ruber]